MKKLRFLLVLLLVGMLQVPTLASEGLDLTKEGSISVLMRDSDTKKIVPGGVLTLYRIGEIYEIDGNVIWNTSGQFVDLKITDVSLSSQEQAELIAEYVEREKITGSDILIDDAGKAYIDGQSAGVYLLVQKKSADGYEKITPFLVSIPMKDTEWVYDVDATPKVTLKAEPIPDEPEEGGKLPQTGQLNWPVPVLTVAGLLLFFTGWALRFGEKETDYEK